jgi:hypothetical protein
MGQVNSASTTVYSEEPKNQTALHRAEYAAEEMSSKSLRLISSSPPSQGIQYHMVADKERLQCQNVRIEHLP